LAGREGQAHVESIVLLESVGRPPVFLQRTIRASTPSSSAGPNDSMPEIQA